MFLNFDNNPQNSLLVEFFCNKGRKELKTYLRHKIDYILPIIEEYIDRIAIILPSIESTEIEEFLRNAPRLFLENLDKFF